MTKNENKVKLTIIDADSLCYICNKESAKESISSLDERIQTISMETNADFICLCVSKGRYFRHEISNNSYKANRDYSKSPKYSKLLKEYLISNYNAYSMNLVEADDICCWLYNKDLGIFDNELTITTKENSNVIATLAAIDKDLLQSIEGEHFNYTYKLEDKSNSDSVIKGWWVETSLLGSYDFIWKQVLMGDAADNVQGLNKIGGKTAEKWINECKEGYASFVLNKYIDHYQSESKAIFEFQKNYRLLHLLSTDEDFTREIGKIPQLPKIIELNKITTNNNNSDGIDELFK